MKHIFSVIFLLVFCSISYSQNPCPGVPTVDYGGKTYNTVQIGSQCWLKENLDIGTLINGSVIQTNNGTIEKYCYNDDPANCTTYGGFYQWNEAMQYVTTPGTKGICPTGWHIPTYAEFQSLATTVSNDGNALKAVGQGTGDGSGTNTSGFSILLTGDHYDGYFVGLGDLTTFWSSTGDNASGSNDIYLGDSDNVVHFYVDLKGNGFSVRCVKDASTGINDHSNNTLPNSIDLYQNYPNPFNPTTLITYSIPASSNVILKVYNVLGKLIITLVNENQEAGIYKVNFDASSLSNGVYFYKIQAGNFVEIKKMLLLK